MMRVLLYIFVLISSLVYANENQKFLSDEFINEINSMQSLWKAGKNFDDSMTLEQIRGMLGALKSPNKEHRELKLPIEDVPESFDARNRWPNCTSIKEIADQSKCGSCWAVSTASAMSDRVCIASGGKSQIRISANNIMSCCRICGAGCNGGYPIVAWEFWETGIPTGGLYNSSVGCQPYPFPPCRHHDSSGNYPACPAESYHTPTCSKKCETSETYTLTYGKDATMLHKEIDIQLQIQKYGPLVVDFNVYEDFLAYKSGVYKHTTGNYAGGHAVRVIGWGVENGIKYWLIANSWNEGWGDKGLFKILRGVNECGIEDGSSAGLPK